MIIRVCIVIVFIILFYSIIPTCVYRLWHCINKTKIHLTNKIYLTFDDGPHPQYTNEILDLLNQLEIKCSFFVVASFAEENPEIIKRMKNEGHLIGLHSLEHKSALYMTPKYTKKDFKNSIRIMKNLGVDVYYFRPPWGHFNIITIMQMKKYNFKPVMWDIMTQDWKSDTTVQEIVNKIEQKINGGDIICLHDRIGENNAPKRTIQALKIVLPVLLDRGFIFDTVDNYKKLF